MQICFEVYQLEGLELLAVFWIKKHCLLHPPATDLHQNGLKAH